MPEDRAARIVWRLLALGYSWEEFQRILMEQQRPEWNQAVAFAADTIREALDEYKEQVRPYLLCGGLSVDSDVKGET